ncbi:hypothetical protein GWI33_014127 [Rhynchophorus ferrugineus]|uniref:Uncharacterized protein n=1 Tax=Rhynchophorus ferrugineus TaxID=354439 RepID=A0A834M763_RHYFE|nr:hypothetical protein GWI33_014127 [Rhynchophorus ferrugineus]
MNSFKATAVILFITLHVGSLHGYPKLGSCSKHPWACGCFRPVIIENRIADQIPIYSVLPSDYGEVEDHLPVPINFFDRSQEALDSDSARNVDLEYVKDAKELCQSIESTTTPPQGHKTIFSLPHPDDKLLKIIQQVSPLLSDTFIPLDLIRVPLLNSISKKSCKCGQNSARRASKSSDKAESTKIDALL